jgi:stage III sporulation protein AA
VVDERGELFPNARQASCFYPGTNTDVLTGCGKQQGIDMLLRTMGPCCIAVDEITEESDCNALVRAGWSGVALLATAHAASVNDLLTRPIYQPLVKTGLFQTILVLRHDKSWHAERTSL